MTMKDRATCDILSEEKKKDTDQFLCVKPCTPVQSCLTLFGKREYEMELRINQPRWSLYTRYTDMTKSLSSKVVVVTDHD